MYTVSNTDLVSSLSRAGNYIVWKAGLLMN